MTTINPFNAGSPISRGELYEKYKKSDPELADKFAGDKVVGDKIGGPSYLQRMGGNAVLAALCFAVYLTIVIGFVTHGFAPVSNPTFYQSALPMLYGVSSMGAIMGLIMVAVATCQKHRALAEKLTPEQIHAIRDTTGIELEETKGAS